MRGLITIGLAILLLAMMSCKSSSITESNSMEEKVFWINSSKFPCVGVAPMSCLQVQENKVIEEGKNNGYRNRVWKNGQYDDGMRTGGNAIGKKSYPGPRKGISLPFGRQLPFFNGFRQKCTPEIIEC